MPESADASKLHLEDLSVGDTFTSGTWTVDPDQIVAFASMYDPQPFHLDADAAEATFFGGLVASGWHVASLTMRLLVESTPVAGGLIGAQADVSWPTPTRPGDVLHVVSEVVDVTPSRSKPDRGIVSVRSETRTARGDVRQRTTAKLVVFRRSAPSQRQASSRDEER